MDETGTHWARVAVVGLVVGALAVSARFRHDADLDAGPTAVDQAEPDVAAVLRVGGALGAVASLVVFVVRPQSVRATTLPLPWGVRWLGGVLAAGSLPLFYWVFDSLGSNVTGTSQTRETHDLVTRGPYRWVRHPLYTVAAVFWVGLTLLTANALVGLSAALAAVGIHLRVPAEEAALEARFGEQYRDYAARTGRYLPILTREHDPRE